MPGKGGMSMKSEEHFFIMAGMDENPARLLATVISKTDLKIDKLPSELNLSKEICNPLVRKLVSKKIIEITSDKTIRITPDFALRAARELEISTEKFADTLRATRFLIVEKFVEEIERVFQTKGYKIKRKTDNILRGPRGPRGLEIRYAFIAEKFYRFGIFVFNSENWDLLKRELPYSYIEHLFLELEERLNCIGTFVFFDPKLSKLAINQIEKFLLAGKKRYAYREERLVFIHEPEEGIREFLENNLNEIEIRRDTVEEHFKRLSDELKSTRELIVLDAMLISQLNSLTSGQYLPHRRKSRQIANFMRPVKSVVDREERNLEIFERKYEEEKTFIERNMDSFDKRLILPNPTDLKERLKRVQKLKSKFEPIKHELNFLTEFLLFPYVKGDEPMKINPFILTEPNDIETFTINQDNIKITANDFFQHLISGGSNLLFVVGAAGTGKTHVLKHVFYSRAKELNIWPIYVDCPMKYDVISNLFVEIVQERNFPQDVHHFLPSLRKLKVLTELEFAEIIKKLHDMMHSQGYKGLILLIDELENSLPYTYDIKYKREFSEKEEAPLALRQLKGILSSDLVRDTGFVFAFRDHILPLMKNSLNLKDFDDFIVNPESLNVKHFKELIELRYKTWNSTQIRFQLPVIKEVASITNLNTRHTIQYFRALYQQALDERKKTVTPKTLDKIGKIPLFLY